MSSKYHLMLRKSTKGSVWYYWYWEGEKQVRKTTGRTKRRGPDGAEEFIERLEATDREREIQRDPVDRIRFREFASPMFLPGAVHLERQVEKGSGIKTGTRLQHRRNIDRLIRWFGDDYLDELTEDRVEDYLAGRIDPGRETLESEEARKERFSVRQMSPSWRNSHIYTLRLVLAEARRKRRITSIPAFEPFRRHSRRQNVLEAEEIDQLFPLCPGALECLWRLQVPRSSYYDEPGNGLMFGTMFALMLSAGLRSGEGRGFWLDQFRPKDGCIVVSRALDDAMVLGLPKEGTLEDPRIRVALIPERTIRIMEWYLALRGRAPGYLFTYHGHPIAGGYLDDRWERGLKAAGISTAGRKLTPHALRYTYNTRMRRRLPPDILRAIVGHVSEDMSEHYDNPAIGQMIQELVPYKETVDGFWSQNTLSVRNPKFRGMERERD
jgi:integrase